MKTFLLAFLLLAQAPARVPAGLIGTWLLDGFRGAAPLGVRHEHALCGAVLMTGRQAVPDGSGGEQVSSLGTVEGTIVISESPAGLVIERKFTGTAGAGAVTHTYPIDGTTSVATGEPSVSGKFYVSGTALNLDTTVTRGKDSARTACSVHEVIEASADGYLQVTATATSGFGTNSRQTWVRK